jgi:hypothetical protein|tara:strand:+ start:3271 stop:5247 length:1977 start_codon:yes stop_codon:yes gene_type:complete
VGYPRSTVNTLPSADEIFDMLEEGHLNLMEENEARMTEEYKDELVPGSARAAAKTKGKRFGSTVDLVGTEDIHNLLMVAGFVPIAGIGADLLDSIIYGVEGQFGMAGISIIASVPGFDWASPMGKSMIQNVKNTVNNSNYAAIVKSSGDKSKNISTAEVMGQKGIDDWADLENAYQGRWYMNPKAKKTAKTKPSFGGYRIKETWTNDITGESVTASVMWKIPEFGNWKKAKDFVRKSYVSREGFDRWKEIYKFDEIFEGKMIDDWQLPKSAGGNKAFNMQTGEKVAWSPKLFDDQLYEIYKKEIGTNLDNAQGYIEFIPKYLRNHKDYNYLGVFRGNPDRKVVAKDPQTGKWAQTDTSPVIIRGDKYYSPSKIREEAKRIYSHRKMEGASKMESLWNAVNPRAHFGSVSKRPKGKTSILWSGSKINRYSTAVHEFTHAAQMNLSAGNNIMVRIADGLEESLGADSANLFKTHMTEKLALSEFFRYLPMEELDKIRNPLYKSAKNEYAFNAALKTSTESATSSAGVSPFKKLSSVELFDIGMPHRYPTDVAEKFDLDYLLNKVGIENISEKLALKLSGSIHQWKYIKKLRPGVAETIVKNTSKGEHQRYVNWWWESEARVAEIRSSIDLGIDYTQTKAYKGLHELYTPATIEGMIKESW